MIVKQKYGKKFRAKWISQVTWENKAKQKINFKFIMVPEVENSFPIDSILMFPKISLSFANKQFW